jgi:2-methylisocitrate lyase-like PEP mutase family enzyme
MRENHFTQEIIHDPEILVIPGVPDTSAPGLPGRSASAVFVSGYASSAATLGVPDVGLMTLTEMVECAARIVDAVELPGFADGDTGHGHVTNLIRTVKQFEKAGVAAMFFEDRWRQSVAATCWENKWFRPKRWCKIKAAVDTGWIRSDGDGADRRLAIHGSTRR